MTPRLRIALRFILAVALFCLAVGSVMPLLRGAAGQRLSGGIATVSGNWIELTVRDVVAFPEASSHVVILMTPDGSVLPILVEEQAAVSIAFQLAHRTAPRPLAGELLGRTLDELGGDVKDVHIHDVDDVTFLTRVRIQQGRKSVAIPAQPSESLPLAMARGAKIFASQHVLDEAGLTPEDMARLREHHPGPGIGGSGPEGDGAAEPTPEINL